MRAIGAIISIMLLWSLIATNTADTKKIIVEDSQRNKVEITKIQRKDILTEIKGAILKSEVSKDGNAIIWVSLRNKLRNPLMHIKQGNIVIIETSDGVRKRVPNEEIKIHKSSDVYPTMTVITRDLSGSMSQESVRQITNAMSVYIDTLSSFDKAMVIDFTHDVRVRQNFTNDKAKLKKALKIREAGGGTALYDAISEGIDNLKRANRRFLKIVISFSDGEDTSSTNSKDNIIRSAKSAHIPIFCIGYGAAYEQSLENIAQETNGLYFFAENVTDLSGIYDQIAAICQNAYLISFPTKAQKSDNVSFDVLLNYKGKEIKLKTIPRFEPDN